MLRLLSLRGKIALASARPHIPESIGPSSDPESRGRKHRRRNQRNLAQFDLSRIPSSHRPRRPVAGDEPDRKPVRGPVRDQLQRRPARRSVVGHQPTHEQPPGHPPAWSATGRPIARRNGSAASVSPRAAPTCEQTRLRAQRRPPGPRPRTGMHNPRLQGIPPSFRPRLNSAAKPARIFYGHASRIGARA
jgi:hypothetical protein